MGKVGKADNSLQLQQLTTVFGLQQFFGHKKKTVNSSKAVNSPKVHNSPQQLQQSKSLQQFATACNSYKVYNSCQGLPRVMGVLICSSEMGKKIGGCPPCLLVNELSANP